MALSIRITCVLGSTTRHTKAEKAAISNTRKTTDIELPNMNTLYSILTIGVNQKIPILTKDEAIIRESQQNSG